MPSGVMERKRDILLVEDTPSFAQTYIEYLRLEPYDVTHVESGEAALSRIRETPPDAILLDIELPGIGGLEVLKALKRDQVGCPVIVITAHGSLKVAVDAMREGAHDFLVKPFAQERLTVTLANALEHGQLARQVETYRKTFEQDEFCGFIGGSLAMQSIYRTIESAAASDATIFVTGESGTGKELCAEAIHQLSRRQRGPFVPVNSASIPRDLMESELFGHVKGAFTGAVADRKGAAARADGGTLFLDEICEMSLDLQPKLLRFVQTGTVQRVGGDKIEPVDVRIVCASNRDPLGEVHAGRLREDLFYRLHVIPIELPPLRERGEDIGMIARHFLTRYADEEDKAFEDFSADAERVLMSHHWPGNVRELQNAVRKAVVLNQGDEITAEMLDLATRAPVAAGPGGTSMPADGPAAAPAAGVAAENDELGGIRTLADVTRDHIQRALEACDGNVAQAAFHLGVDPSTIYRQRRGWKDEA